MRAPSQNLRRCSDAHQQMDVGILQLDIRTFRRQSSRDSCRFSRCASHNRQAIKLGSTTSKEQLAHANIVFVVSGQNKIHWQLWNQDMLSQRGVTACALTRTLALRPLCQKMFLTSCEKRMVVMADILGTTTDERSLSHYRILRRALKHVSPVMRICPRWSKRSWMIPSTEGA